MTTPAATAREREVLSRYEQMPMPDGDVVLLLDDEVCLELAGMADDWQERDGEHLAAVLTQATSRSVRLLIARRGGEPLVADYRLWRDLHGALRDSGLDLRPLGAVRAA